MGGAEQNTKKKKKMITALMVIPLREATTGDLFCWYLLDLYLQHIGSAGGFQNNYLDILIFFIFQMKKGAPWDHFYTWVFTIKPSLLNAASYFQGNRVSCWQCCVFSLQTALNWSLKVIELGDDLRISQKETVLMICQSLNLWHCICMQLALFSLLTST